MPSLDEYIQDRLNNPVHVPRHGTIKALRLVAPVPELVRRIVEARLRPALEELPDFGDLSSIYPFSEEQVTRIAVHGADAPRYVAAIPPPVRSSGLRRRTSDGRGT